MPLITAATATIGTPTLWAVTIGLVLALLVLDFVLTRRPHEVTMREALVWSAFYVALPLAFGGWVWWQHGTDRGVEYLTGYLVEKSLSVDNLLVFMLLLGAFAVPPALRQRVLLYGIVGAGAARDLHRPRRGRARGVRLGLPRLRPRAPAHRREDPPRHPQRSRLARPGVVR